MARLYKERDFEQFMEKKDDILAEVDAAKAIMLEPTLVDIKAINQIILNFLMEKNRKLYGGLALHYLMIKKNPKEAIYGEFNPGDIDFYSPDPLRDTVEICNRIYKGGYYPVDGRNAQHKDTYKIFVNYKDFCDITYVPKNIYNRMPYETYNFGRDKVLTLIHPHFMTVDIFRMLSDPILSYWRIDKNFKRLISMLKYYPFPEKKNPINITGSNEYLDMALDKSLDFIKSKFHSCIVIGFYAYNYFLMKSGITKSSSKIKLLRPPYYEVVSTNYKTDAMDIITYLKEALSPYGSDLVTYTEHYPFFQFTGYSVRIRVGGELVVIVYSNDLKCRPYQDVDTYSFSSGKPVKMPGTIRIGSWSLTILHILISIFYARTNHEKADMDIGYTMLSHLNSAREYFYNKTNKSITDNSVFKDFIVTCSGKTIDPATENRMLFDAKRKKGKRPGFSYKPETASDDFKIPDYTFQNTSGNPINKDKNLRLFKESQPNIDDETKSVIEKEINEESEEDFDEKSIKQ